MQTVWPSGWSKVCLGSTVCTQGGVYRLVEVSAILVQMSVDTEVEQSGLLGAKWSYTVLQHKHIIIVLGGRRGLAGT